MASQTNVRNIIRAIKNNPAAITSERVLVEYDPDKGSLVRRAALVETVALGGAAFAALTTALPANARVIFAGYYLTTAVTLTTAVKIGLGTAADPDAFGRSGTAMTIGTTENFASADSTSTITTSVTPRVSTVDTSGAAAGTGVGSVKVVLIYEYLQAIQA